MEGLGVKQFDGVYGGRRVLLTGHTGFKGSWLATWLCSLGARVTGLALAPQAANHWELLENDLADLRGDIRDQAVVADAFARSRPEIVFHLAAQTLVRESYGDPSRSWSTNVMGTVNVLEACRRTAGVQAVVVVTTDKVYANREWDWGYREVDRLGGHDPYSASKAATELVVESYRKSFWQADAAPLVATARAGNVIGGGDWAEDRLIPDLVRALYQDLPLEIRSPAATRPWQHVLEPLAGYLLLGQRLLDGDRACADAWNFGPAADDNLTVAELLRRLRLQWPELHWTERRAEGPHEAGLLLLDCAKARRQLGWRPVMPLDQGLAMTAEWYRHYRQTGQALSKPQLARYLDQAMAAGCAWLAS